MKQAMTVLNTRLWSHVIVAVATTFSIHILPMRMSEKGQVAAKRFFENKVRPIQDVEYSEKAQGRLILYENAMLENAQKTAVKIDTTLRRIDQKKLPQLVGKMVVLKDDFFYRQVILGDKLKGKIEGYCHVYVNDTKTTGAVCSVDLLYHDEDWSNQ